MKVLVAKLGKSDNERSDVSLGLRRFYYNSCSINRFFINVLRSIMFKEAFIAMVQVQSTASFDHERSQSNEASSCCQNHDHDRMRLAPIAEIV